MTLTGFEHTSKSIAMKKKLDTGSIRPEFQDIISSSRRSRSRMSRDSYREDLQNPPSEGKSGRSTNRDAFQVIEANEVPPMNADIISQDENAIEEPVIESADLSMEKQRLACNVVLPQGCEPEELNPRNYAYLPSCWTSKIRPAGRATAKKQSLQGILS
mmetsp:Transcript_30403/g.40420  ORF Transcript_30403/g.40420 Transcript_30403/m.40420 type:complete len:159 (+) Transcript_30403:1411-1887(+)